MPERKTLNLNAIELQPSKELKEQLESLVENEGIDIDELVEALILVYNAQTSAENLYVYMTQERQKIEEAKKKLRHTGVTVRSVRKATYSDGRESIYHGSHVQNIIPNQNPDTNARLVSVREIAVIEIDDRNDK